MTAWDDPIVVATLTAGILGIVGAFAYIVYDRRKGRLNIELERFEEHISPPQSPTETAWSVRVRPSKTMEHAMVFVGTMSMPIPHSHNSPIPLEIKIPAGGAENFRIPVSTNPSWQTISVKEGNKLKKKQKWEDIPLVHA